MKPVLAFFLYVLLELFEKSMVDGIYCSSIFCRSARTTLSKHDTGRLGSCRASRLNCAVICKLRQNCTVFAHDPDELKCYMGEESSMLPLDTHYRLAKTSIEGWCPISDGYQLLADGGPCVKFFTDLRTWSDANRTCAGFSPSCRLAVLDTQHKNELVRRAGMAMNKPFSTAISIGLSDHTGEGFRWIDGTGLSFQDWGVDGKLENPRINCVSIWRYQGWHWVVSPCIKKLHFVCEIVPNV